MSPLLSNLNRDPYWNDYNPNSHYQDILFKAGLPIQARELNNLQSSIYNQIEELGSRFFRNGDHIANGGYSYQQPVDYVRLSSFTQGAKVEDFIGSLVKGVVSGAVAEVIFATPQTEDDDATLYVNYVSSGIDAEQKVFTEGELLESDTDNNYTASIGITNTSKPITSSAIGYGSIFTAEPGSFWINGRIVRSEKQTITVDKYGTKGCGQVGYNVDEDFVTSNEDESLKDNAQGSSNFAAPGADRMRITLHLGIRYTDTEIPNFIPLVNIMQGMIIGSPTQSVKWDWLYDVLAERTFEESGNYTVTEFQIEPMFYQNTDEIDGVYEADPERYGEDTPYPPCPPTHLEEGPLYCGQEGLKPGDPGYMKPLTLEEADAKYVLKVSPGLAYVYGYRVGFSNPYYICGHKPRDKGFKPDTYTQMNPGAFVKVENTYGTPDFRNIRDVVDTDAFGSIIYYRNFTDGYISDSFNSLEAANLSDLEGDAINQIRPLNVGNKPWTTYHILLHKGLGEIDFFTGTETTVDVIKPNGARYTGIVVYPTPELRREPDPDPEPIDDNIYVMTNPDVDHITTQENEKFTVSKNTMLYKNVTIKSSGHNSIVLAFRGDDVPVIGRGDAIDVGNGESILQMPKALVAKKIDPIKAGVLQPKYFYGDVLVDQNTNGFFGPNSIYNMGIISSTDFLELVATDVYDTSLEEWQLGYFVFGEKSGALGKLEDVRQNVLVLSNVYGTFIEGELVYQLTGREDNEVILRYLNANPNGEFITTQLFQRLVLNGDELTTSKFKYARLIREGEVISLNFNSHMGDPTVGGGGDKELADQIFAEFYELTINKEAARFTNEVFLTNPFEGRGLRLPPEAGLETQEDANHWFYYSILSLQQGLDANNVYIEDVDPVELDVDGPHIGDIWINKENYVLYVRTEEETINLETNEIDGMIEMWVGVTPGETPTNLSPATVKFIDDYYAAQIDTTPFNSSVPQSDFDLSNETSVIVTSLGARLKLNKADDFTHNASTNSLELTEDGRNKIYKFTFFNPGGEVVMPRINYELITQPNSVRGYATTSPAKIFNDIKKSKAFFSELSDVNNFSSDASLISSSGADTENVANGSLFSGTVGRNYITCDNFTGDASEDLLAGDAIVVATGINSESFEYKIVSFVTKPYGYGKKKTKCTIYFTTTLEGSVKSSMVQRLRLKKFGSEDNLIFQLPASTVSSLETNHDITKINYKVFREYVGGVIENGSAATFSTLESNSTFISDPYKCVITISETQESLGNYVGRSVALDPVTPILLSDGGRDITLKFSQPIPDSAIIKAILPVQVTNGRAKRKILKRNEEIVVENMSRTTDSKFEQRIIPLRSRSIVNGREVMVGYKDIFKLHSITTQNAAGDVLDVTDNYVLDDGQRSSYYDMGRVVLKQGRPFPTGDLTIKFDYFDHVDGVGQDFFSVDSYTHEEGIPYEEIPVFHPSTSASTNQTSAENSNFYMKLRDCIDFRPSVNTEGSNATLDPMYDLGEDTLSEKVFNYDDKELGGNSFVSSIPIPTTQFVSDIEYYLPKIDSLFLDKTGKMILSAGEPSDNPVAPPDIATAIRLYDLHMPAYTFDVKDITIRKYNHRRYTMKDIMDIDRRVERVEQLVGLSIVEQSALNANVRDAVTGLERFKNGIVVDTFGDHSKGDVGSNQYRCSIDPKESHLRAPFVSTQIDLEEVNETDLQRASQGYSQHNNIVTCDYSVVDYLGQPYATTSVPVQISTSSVFEGTISLYPPVDTFRDNTKLPKLIVDNSEIYASSLNLTKELEQAGLGTVWSEWETLAGLPANRVNHNGTERTNKELDKVVRRDTQFNTGHLYVAPTSASMQKARNYVNLGRNVNTNSVQNTSYGDRLFDVQLSHTMRSIPVYFKAERLKPNTRYYAFFDDINVSDWICVDKIDANYPDELSRYGSQPNDEPKGFGESIISDSDGNITGVFIIPNGRSPLKGSVFTGKMEDLEYETSGNTRSFSTGQRSFKLSSSPNVLSNLTDIQGYAKTDFVSRIVLNDKSESIVSTRVPELTTNTLLQESVRLNHERLGSNDYNPGVVPSPVPTPCDPIAQTFQVDKNFPDGVFVTEMDLFFREKDQVQGVEAYIVSTETGVPTNKIVPHSRVVMPSSTILRVTCKLNNNIKSTYIEAGTVVKGMTSGATGVVKSYMKFDSGITNPTENVNNTVYNMVLSNNLHEFLPGETIVPQINPENVNEFKIALDEVTVTRIDVKTLGRDYRTASVVVSPPELPGGVNAEASIRVAPMDDLDGHEGQVYDIIVDSSGSGYTKKPSIQILGNGVNAIAEARIVDGRKAVTMGVATSDDATAPTKFRFKAPVFLLGNKTYAFVVKSPTSDKYSLWTSKVGDVQIGTNKKVVTQPNTGSLFVSQNHGIWTEDKSMDITFALRRANFDVNSVANLHLQNYPLSGKIIQKDPIQTGLDRIINPTMTDNIYSKRFGYNKSMVKVYHYGHGLVKGDMVLIDGVTGNPGNVPNSKLNTLHKVVDVDIDEFVIDVGLTEGERENIYTSKSGGDKVYCSFNRPYETIQLVSGLMTFQSSSLVATNRTTQHAGLPTLPMVVDTDDDYSVSYQGYNQVNSYRMETPEDIPLMDTYYYTGAKQVAGAINEALYSDDSHLRGKKSMDTNVVMSTNDSRVSPVIDLDRTNMLVVHNMIDNPDGNTSVTKGGQTATIRFKDSISGFNRDSVSFTTRSGETFTLPVSDVSRTAKSITITGVENVSQLLNASTFNTSGITDNVFDVTITPTSGFITETQNNGTTYSKWISKLFVFDTECDGVEVRLSSILYDAGDIRVYYKARNSGIDPDFSTVNWTPFNPRSIKPNETRKELFAVDQGDEQRAKTRVNTNSFEKTPGLPDNVDTLKVRNSINVDPRNIMADEWQTLIYSVQDLIKFDAIAIKVVMVSHNPALTPLIDDISVICTE